LAFTRNPSDTDVSPATYTADGASDLILVDQKRNISIDGSDKGDNIRVSASALASSSLYNFDVRGFAGNDDITFNAALIQDSTINGNEGNDTLSIGDRITLNVDSSLFPIGFPLGTLGSQVAFNNSYLLGGKGNDTLTGDDVNGGEINGNIGNDSIFLNNDSTTGFNQYIGGGQGNDLIRVAGYYTDSIIDGNKGIDTIIIESGVHSGSSVNGGEGNDIIRSSGLSKGIVLNGDIGNDTIASGTAATLSTALGATITGGEGNDTIVSFANAGQSSTIDAGVGADTVVTVDGSITSTGKETIIFNAGDSVAASKATASAGVGGTLDTAFTITYGKGVDTLLGINTSDKIDIDFDAKSVTNVNGGNLTAVLASNVVYEVVGTFTDSTGVFVADNTGTDYIYIVGGDNLTLGQVFTNSANTFVTNEQLNIGDFG
jgi:hypothetical protein